MRILITTAIIWAILLGFFATGVKVMATSPQAMPIQAAEVTSDNHSQVNLDRDPRVNDEIRPSGEVRNGLRLNR